MADIFDLPDNLSRKGLEKMAGIKYDPDEFFNRRKPTNADRIRAMSDEELAEAFAMQCAGRVCKGIPFDGKNECVKCWLDWLKAEVE